MSHCNCEKLIHELKLGVWFYNHDCVIKKAVFLEKFTNEIGTHEWSLTFLREM